MDRTFYQFCVMRDKDKGWCTVNVSPELPGGLVAEAYEERSDMVVSDPDFLERIGTLEKIYVRSDQNVHSDAIVHSQTKLTGTDKGNRLVFFSHCYVRKDAYSSLKEPETFLALAEENFRFSEEDTAAIPETLTFDPPLGKADELCRRLGIDRPLLPTLAKCFLLPSFLNSKNVQLFVVSGTDRSAAKEILCLLWSLLPYSLRPMYSASTYGKEGMALGTIVFTDEVPGRGYWFNPFTGENNILSDEYENALKKDAYLLRQAESAAETGEIDPTLFDRIERFLEEQGNKRDTGFKALRLAYRTLDAEEADEDELIALIGKWGAFLENGKDKTVGRVLRLTEKLAASLKRIPDEVIGVLKECRNVTEDGNHLERIGTLLEENDAYDAAVGDPERAMALLAKKRDEGIDSFARFCAAVKEANGQSRIDAFYQKKTAAAGMPANPEERSDALREWVAECRRFAGHSALREICAELLARAKNEAESIFQKEGFDAAANGYLEDCNAITGRDLPIPDTLINRNANKFYAERHYNDEPQSPEYRSFLYFFSTFRERFEKEATFFDMAALACEDRYDAPSLEKLKEYLTEDRSPLGDRVCALLLGNGTLIGPCTDLHFWKMLTDRAGMTGKGLLPTLKEMCRKGCVLFTDKTVLADALDNDEYWKSYANTNAVTSCLTDKIRYKDSDPASDKPCYVSGEIYELLMKYRTSVLVNSEDKDLPEDARAEKDKIRKKAAADIERANRELEKQREKEAKAAEKAAQKAEKESLSEARKRKKENPAPEEEENAAPSEQTYSLPEKEKREFRPDEWDKRYEEIHAMTAVKGMRKEKAETDYDMNLYDPMKSSLGPVKFPENEGDVPPPNAVPAVETHKETERKRRDGTNVLILILSAVALVLLIAVILVLLLHGGGETNPAEPTEPESEMTVGTAPENETEQGLASL